MRDDSTISQTPTKTHEHRKCEIYSRDQHTISRRLIDPDALKIMYRLVSNGYKAYLVGGGVRDLLLKKKPKDFDVATDATPRKIKDLFRNSRIIGRRFKLIHVYFRGNKIIEVSTFRDSSDLADSETTEENEDLLITRDNKYGTEETDAIRRDITINALFYDLSNFTIIDYVGGMKDLQSKLVRVIGCPEVRFAEDPVRLLRVVRHAARAEFTIETSCYQAICSNAQLIKKSTPVRVFEELKKDLTSAYSLAILKLLSETGLLNFLMPEVQDKKLLTTGSDFTKALSDADTMVKAGISRSATIAFAIIAIFLRSAKLEGAEHEFFGADDIEEHVFSIFKSLAVPRKERERIAALLEAWHRVLTDTKEIKKASELIRSELRDDIISLFNILYGSESALTSYVVEIIETLPAGSDYDEEAVSEKHSVRSSRSRRSKPRGRRIRKPKSTKD